MTFEEKMRFTAQQISTLMEALSDTTCEYIPPLTDEDIAALPDDAQDNNYDRLYEGNSYMRLRHRNGTTYYVNITADSPYAACQEVFEYAAYHI